MTTPPGGAGSPKGEISPEDKAQFERRLSDLGQQIGKVTAPKDGRDTEVDAARSRAMGMGFSIAGQLVAGVLVGGGIGYWLDRWLGTQPWLMVLFLVFGFAAGLVNVVRMAREMQRISEAQSKGAVSVPDDEEDS